MTSCQVFLFDEFPVQTRSFLKVLGVSPRGDAFDLCMDRCRDSKAYPGNRTKPEGSSAKIDENTFRFQSRFGFELDNARAAPMLCVTIPQGSDLHSGRKSEF